LNTDAIFNAAHTTAIRILESGAFIPPDSTVCTIQSASGRIFTGISRNEMKGHVSVPVHAEVDAINNMLASGESAVSTLLLIGTQSRMPMLPCNNCIGYLLSLDPMNGECLIIMPDRMIKLAEAAMYSAPPQSAPAPQMYMGGAYPNGNNASASGVQPQFVADTTATTENAKNELLKNKVNSLLGVADDNDDEDEEKKDKPKKGLFGLFRK